MKKFIVTITVFSAFFLSSTNVFSFETENNLYYAGIEKKDYRVMTSLNISQERKLMKLSDEYGMDFHRYLSTSLFDKNEMTKMNDSVSLLGFTFFKDVYINNGVVGITDGNVLGNQTCENIPVMISEKYATLYDLHVGSIFNLYNIVYFFPAGMDLQNYSDFELSNWDYRKNTKKVEDYIFEVVGIFDIPDIIESEIVLKDKYNYLPPEIGLFPGKIKDVLTELENTIIIPDFHVLDIKEKIITNEYNTLNELYDGQKWWNEGKKDWLGYFTKDKLLYKISFSTDCLDTIREFEERANLILFPDFEIKTFKIKSAK